MRQERQRLSDVITDKLEAMILDGSFIAGCKLPSERELALRFDVSRPSLREAMGNLQAKGLVERKQGGGTFVSKQLNAAMTDPLMALVTSKPEAQFDLLEFRHALEGMAAYYAALRGQPDDYRRLSVALDTLNEPCKAASTRQQAEALGEFYMTMAKAAHNAVLLHVMRTMRAMLVDNIERNLNLLSESVDVGATLSTQRKEIVDAIVTGNPDTARQASNSHLAFIEETLLQINQRDTRVQRALRRIETTKIGQ
ncbi:GntR family transcriptional regulator [Alteromonas sp. 5E99-2]|uniref:GntR family transcriptional regulator n=1 Tax=Alteromonas sp. 5E99-2 TaxID=2817683 RepID=UPI001A993352|nr:GntR family transcriptional regulator [Alteromonas sp. 5E99-2]MBO1256443.1 GntR family transcriptional regulator [Alteromonas sp. 5E99-2]